MHFKISHYSHTLRTPPGYSRYRVQIPDEGARAAIALRGVAAEGSADDRDQRFRQIRGAQRVKIGRARGY